MKTTDLNVFQTIDLGLSVVLVGLFILAVGYGFYRRTKLSGKDK